MFRNLLKMFKNLLKMNAADFLERYFHWRYIRDHFVKSYFNDPRENEFKFSNDSSQRALDIVIYYWGVAAGAETEQHVLSPVNIFQRNCMSEACSMHFQALHLHRYTCRFASLGIPLRSSVAQSSRCYWRFIGRNRPTLGNDFAPFFLLAI